MFDPLLVIILAGLIGPLLAARRRPIVPAVLGELLAGVAIGRSGLAIIDPSTPANGLLYGLGFAMLMLVAGSHVDVRSPAMRAGLRPGTIAVGLVALLAVPLGLAIGVTLAPAAPPILFAILLAGSSAAVAFPILEERGLIGPRVALLLVWIPLADGLTVLLMPLTLVGAAAIPGAIGGDGLIVAATVVAVWFVDRVARSPRAMVLGDRSRARGWALQLRLTLLVLVALSSIATHTGGSTLVAGFGAGLVIARLREPSRLEVQLSGVAEGFFVPAFFILLGAQLDLRALIGNQTAIFLALTIATSVLAIHLVAARVVAPAAWRGFGLAAAAQLGLPAATASLGLSTGVLSPALAAAIVLAGCLTLLPASIGSRRLANVLGGTVGDEVVDRSENRASQSGELIARETERLVVEAFLADSSSGPRALVLEGEAGIGKSTLFASAVTAARQRFSFVFASRPDESERSLANVVLGDLFGEIPATIREALPAPRRRAFERALLVSSEAVETELDPRALEVAILSILGALTRDGPLLIAIDGDQWADRSSIEALAFAVRRLTDQPLRLLLARRADGGAAPGSGLDLAVSTTAGPGAVERLRLGPLSVGAIQALLRSRVGLTLSRPRLLRLAEASGGNPFFALELARSQPSADPGVPLPVPLSLERMLGGRLDRLDEQTRRGLLLIAAHGRWPRELLERLGVVRTVVERAVGEQVLEVSDHVVRFAHPLLASTVYQRASPEERRTAHQQNAAPSLPDAHEQARHARGRRSTLKSR